MLIDNLFKKFLKLLKLFANKTTRKGLYNNIPACVELEGLLMDLKINTVIDVGSNKGQFILLIEKLYKNIQIYSFEPILELYEKQKKFFRNNENIKFFNSGLGAYKSNKKLNITRKKDSSSVLEIKNSNLLGKKFEILEEREIQILTLDSALKDYNLYNNILLKLDVQGYELEVLKGANKLLSKIKYIIIEIVDSEFYHNQVIGSDILDYLTKNNYKILKSCNEFNIKRINYSQRDVLLVNKSF